MPGVYAKDIHTDSYKKLRLLINQCMEKVQRKTDYQSIRESVALIMVLTAAKTQKVIEEFCYAQGFTLFFEILKLRAEDKQYGSIQSILDYLNSLMTLEVDPYDESTGVLPMLVYFLTERHTHYVDITWNSVDLKYMAEFLLSYITLINNYKKQDLSVDEVKSAIMTLAYVLRLFPAHRVYSKAANVFTPELCSDFIAVLNDNEDFWNSISSIKITAECLLGMASFGMGYVLSLESPSNQILITLHSQLIRELRCPCSRCEHLRRFQHVIRDRDEFGVSQAVESKRNVPRALAYADITKLIVILLQNLQDQNTIQQNKENIKNLNFEDFRKNPIEDDVKKIIVTLIWLLSDLYLEMFESSILAINDYELLTALLQSLNFSDIRYWFNVENLECSPGAKYTLECICGLLLRSDKQERIDIYNRSKASLEAVLERSCTFLIDEFKGDFRSWKPEMSSFIILQTALLAAVYIGPKPSSFANAKLRKKEMQTPLRSSCFQVCLQATHLIYEGYDWAGKTSINETVFITILLICMGILVNGYEYSRCIPERKMFFPLPNVGCAFMASAARNLIQKFKENLSNGEGCVIIKNIGSLVISRAEKAASIMIPTNEDKYNLSF